MNVEENQNILKKLINYNKKKFCIFFKKIQFTIQIFMELKNIKFSVILPILERNDIVKGFPMAIQSIFQNTLVPDQVLVVVDGLVSKSFKGLIMKLKKKYLFELLLLE
mgnify:CR=1 FL=1